VIEDVASTDMVTLAVIDSLIEALIDPDREPVAVAVAERDVLSDAVMLSLTVKEGDCEADNELLAVKLGDCRRNTRGERKIIESKEGQHARL
jgi:hypothetical protein